MARKTDQSENDVELFVRLPESLKGSARVQAAKRGKSMSEHIRDLIRQAPNGPTDATKGMDVNASHPEPSGDSEASDNGTETEESEHSSNSSDPDGPKDTDTTEETK